MRSLVEGAVAPIYRVELAAGDLLTRYRPTHPHPNKLHLIDLALSGEPLRDASVALSRWPTFQLPSGRIRLGGEISISAVPGYFTYDNEDQSGQMVWHLNFADLDAFSTWITPLFAQDELQVAEHPTLAALFLMTRECDLNIRTEDDSEDVILPTPILASGIERRLSIETQKSRIYGNAFQHATLAQVVAATQNLYSSSLSNILAIRAPEPGIGTYGVEEIHQILTTAFSGFSAACAESNYIKGDKASVQIHSGFWGCGAYGGNRMLMLLLQMLAASMAGVGKITFHLGSDVGQKYFDEAHALFNRIIVSAPQNLEVVISELAAMQLPWGISDGN